MPTYNGARFLVEQVESIFAQTDGDFELLAIDDGSSDETAALLADLAARDGRMRVIPSAGNRGQNLRLGELLARAAGDHIAVADQDDIWAPDRNERLFAALGGRAMALGRSELIDAEGREVGKSLLELSNVTPGPHWRLRSMIEPMFSAHATITRREAVNVASLGHPLPFDWLMAMEAMFADGLAYVDDAVVFHRMHDANQMNKLELNGANRLSGGYMRWLLLYQRPLRLRFWLMLDYLSRSALVGAEARAAFRPLAGRAHAVWFAQWRSLRSADAGLRGQVKEALRRYAGSEQDWAFFSDQVDALTSLPGAPGMLREVGRRFRL